MPADNDANWGKYLGIGLEMAIGALLGYFVGRWLDNRYGWSPWGVMIGSMTGVAAGMYMLIKEGIAMNKDDKKDRK
jgi:F0F1-type ATP synthase assembly protein I